MENKQNKRSSDLKHEVIKTREILFEQLQLLKEKAQVSKSISELILLNKEIVSISSVLLSRNFIN